MSRIVAPGQPSKRHKNLGCLHFHGENLMTANLSQWNLYQVPFITIGSKAVEVQRFVQQWNPYTVQFLKIGPFLILMCTTINIWLLLNTLTRVFCHPSRFWWTRSAVEDSPTMSLWSWWLSPMKKCHTFFNLNAALLMLTGGTCARTCGEGKKNTLLQLLSTYKRNFPDRRPRSNSHFKKRLEKASRPSNVKS